MNSRRRQSAQLYRNDWFRSVRNSGGRSAYCWVNGQLVFRRTSLREVAAELERYHPVQFTFADPKLAQETLSGTFNSDDMIRFCTPLRQSCLYRRSGTVSKFSCGECREISQVRFLTEATFKNAVFGYDPIQQ